MSSHQDMEGLPSPGHNTVVDPVCGMHVDPQKAKGSVEYAGKTYHFCSARCAERFAAEPEKFLKPKPPAEAFVQLSALTPAARPPTPRNAPVADGAVYVCPMDPEVRESKPGPCPVCGMALERETLEAVEYTCPMHPEIIRNQPGSCPICGMALELRVAFPGAHEEDDSELRSMQRRFWVGVALTVPLLVLSMGGMIEGSPLHRLPAPWMVWIQLALATPVVVWGGWPFFQRGWASIVNRRLNMFTLIALGTGTA